jgi:hypothetical protein
VRNVRLRPTVPPGGVTLVSIGNLVAIAIILEVIPQFLIFREFHPFAALLVGPAVIAVPYSLSRALTNRIARGRAQQGAAGRSG